MVAWRHGSSLRRWFFAAFGIGIISLLAFSYYLSNFNTLVRRPAARPRASPFRCHSLPPDGVRPRGPPADHHASSARLRLDAKVLVLVETQYSALGRQLVEVLEAARFKFKVEAASGRGGLPMLTSLDKGKFAAVVFENMERFLSMSKWNKELLLKYCREYHVGIVGFLRPAAEEPAVVPPRPGFPHTVHSRLELYNARLNPDSPVLRLTRPGEVYRGQLPGDWSVLVPPNSSYVPVAWAQPLYPPAPVNGSSEPTELVTVLQDPGIGDQVPKVLFGSGFQFWLHRLLFLDALSFLSHGKLSLPLQRHLLIDIDDIFVGERGTRMKPADVYALLEAQRKFQTMVNGFRFNLGFSGKFYHKGTAEENEGDNLLIKYADKFWWFCHMWSHSQPHLFANVTALEMEMRMNREFARTHHIPTDSGYSVAPHHSGVFPVHEPLYEAWKKVWNVKVTSTEEYPHLRPARLRRGFMHRNIMVLPRQTCGLYTHTIFLHKYPSGPEKLEASIHGGELFYTFVTNPVNVFMTHLSNYGNDRLALYTFESVLKFVHCWTNLDLATVPPLQLAHHYFQAFPEETDPLWKNPCDDKRHMSIWAPNKSCEQLPKFLVIGPQKTGTTALYTFLSMHPAILSNYPSPETFEEVQFFNGRNYYRGLDWYMSFFPVPKNSTDRYLFEKSATYFDGELVPLRAHTLLPTAKLITILISPVKRAYSWYQHMRTHRDSAALNFTFYEVVTADERAPRVLRDLRNRCLNPGMYAQHLERWLSYFPPSQLMIIDGEALKANPILVMNTLQRFLQIKPFYDYHHHLRYDPKKGFFCQVTQRNSTRCLGRSKGRHYPILPKEAERFLRKFYLAHNVALSKLLDRLNLPAPSWLREALTTA